MTVNALVEVLVKGTHQAFRHVTDPFYVHSDFPWQYGPSSWFVNGDTVHDYDSQCVYPAPVRVPHDQTSDGYYGSGGCGGVDLPVIDWTSLFGPLSYRCSQPLGFQELYQVVPQADSDGAHLEAVADVLCQGVTFLWNRFDPNASMTAYPAAGPYTTFMVSVGAGDDERIYSVIFFGEGEVVISKSDDHGVTWKDIERAAVGADVWQAAWGNPDPKFVEGAHTEDPHAPGTDLPCTYNVLEFRLIAGRLEIRIGSQDRIYKYDEARIGGDGNPIWTINKLHVNVYKFVALALSAHPTKWANACIFDSQEIPIGFVNTNVAPAYISSAGVVPPAWVAGLIPAGTFLDGPIVYYRLEITGPVAGAYQERTYSDFVAAVRSVNLIWTANVISLIGPNRPALPESVVVDYSFNPMDLTLASAAKCIFNNNRPVVLPTSEFGFYGQWLMAYGQNGCQINAKRTRDGFDDLVATIFTGYGNTAAEIDGQLGASQAVMSCGDRSIQHKSPRFALPWMDGWNSFYAQGYLSQLCHVDLSDMYFQALVPPDPFTDLGDEDGQPAYFLPVGSAGSALTRFSGVDVWEIQKKIAYSIGYVLGYDVFGHLHYQKFRVAPGIKRTFYESDPQSGGLNGCWSIRAGKTMEEVRSDAIIVGIDAFAPLYDTIAVKHTDPAVEFDINAFNHLGYSNPFVWVDSQFAQAQFADTASQQMLYFLRLPGLFVSLTTWLNPDIAPLDVITMQADKFGVSAIRLLVLSVRHTINMDLGTTTIMAKLVPVL